MASLPRPTHKTLKAFHQIFFNKTSEDPGEHPLLVGSSKYLYDDEEDLVALKVPEHPDLLTTFVQDHMGYMFEVRNAFQQEDNKLFKIVTDEYSRQEKERDRYLTLQTSILLDLSIF
jgi:hypothetical protein